MYSFIQPIPIYLNDYLMMLRASTVTVKLSLISTIFILATCFVVQPGDAKIYTWKPRDMLPSEENITNFWKNRLLPFQIGQRMRKINESLYRFSLPNVPKLMSKRLTVGNYDPCRVVNNICLNGGICLSVGDEFFCECPKTHYGKHCEFNADQIHCNGNMCQNEATCYSIKSPRTVPNWDIDAVKKCTAMITIDPRHYLKCNYMLSLRYMCWCKFGFEGPFCEFTEGMRCCAEDFCHHHGLIEHLSLPESKDQNATHLDKTETCNQDKFCKCHCEENYTGKRCESISPCINADCMNGGTCNELKGNCRCPTPEQFMEPFTGVKIYGDNCEMVEVPHPDAYQCLPCTGSFKKYADCVNTKRALLGFDISHYFAKCANDECRQRRNTKTCLNGGKCQAVVANVSKLGESNEADKPFLLVPKCDCVWPFEGDFCEDLVLDECDLEDLKLNEDLSIWNETLIREMKRRIFGKALYMPEGTLLTSHLSRVFEIQLRERGMKTFCGGNGLCRPHRIEDGIQCKCAAKFKGTRCEIVDPCWGNGGCAAGSLCVDLPTSDLNAKAGDQQLITTCICNTSHSVDYRTHQCMQQHGSEYAICFGENGQPKCQNDGHCYPCGLDERVLGKTDGVQHQQIRLCDEWQKRRGLRCTCPPGFRPPFCATETTPCDFHRCQNNATCAPARHDSLSYKCRCLLGYSGPLCEQIDDICLQPTSKCGNGTCFPDPEKPREFYCDCSPGYHGPYCDKKEARGWRSFINENSSWTYPLLLYIFAIPLFALVLHADIIYEAISNFIYGLLQRGG